MQAKTASKTIITRVPTDLAVKVEEAAAKELMPVAAYVRRLILQAVQDRPRAA